METGASKCSDKLSKRAVINQKGSDPLQLELDFTVPQRHKFIESDRDIYRDKWFILRSYGDDPEKRL